MKWNYRYRLADENCSIQNVTTTLTIAELEPVETCDDLAETANALSRRIISKNAAAERDYDARTNFGEAQGAVFP